MRIRNSLRLWLLLGVAAFVCRIGHASSAAEVIVSGIQIGGGRARLCRAMEIWSRYRRLRGASPYQEGRIGKPASFGCVRMRSRDVIALYDRVHIGMHVTVTQKPFSDFLAPENVWASAVARDSVELREADRV